MKSKSSLSVGILLILLLVVIIIIGVYVSGFYIKFEPFTNSKKYTLQYYCMPSCRYCEEFENNVWNSLVSDVAESPNKYNFNTIKYDITVGDGIKQSEIYNINSTPTILLVENGTDRYATFNGNRTKSAILEFTKEKTLTEKTNT
jgi:hypothetical protein